LEQHHAATTFLLMRKEKNNFLARMEPQIFQFFRKLVVTNILATDMKEHFEYQNKFEAFCNEIKDKQHEFGKKKICIYYNGA
jgi:cAMP-specific phosphodiesterase 4